MSVRSNWGYLEAKPEYPARDAPSRFDTGEGEGKKTKTSYVLLFETKPVPDAGGAVSSLVDLRSILSYFVDTYYA